MGAIEYPYMPEGRSLKFASVDDPFMQAAQQARVECAGDPLFPIGAVLVKDGQVIARAGNGFNRGPGAPHVCPRVVQNCPSGTGYEFCDLHDAPGHTEVMTLQAAQEAGEDPTGADLYMYGHWWACEPCWTALIEAGVRDVYVLDDAHERFSRERVYAETLTTTVKRAYIAGPITGVNDFETWKTFYESLGDVCEAMGVTARIPHRDNALNETEDTGTAAGVYAWATQEAQEADVVIADVTLPSLGVGGELVEAAHAGTHIVLLSKESVRVSRFVTGNPAVVYHVVYTDQQDACDQLSRVLKQL